LLSLEISNDSALTTSSGIPAAVVTNSALVVWTEPVVNGPATEKLQRSPITDISRSHPAALRFRGTGKALVLSNDYWFALVVSLVDSSAQNPRAALETGSLGAAPRCAETSAAWTSSRRNPTPGSRANSWARGSGQPDAKP